MHYPPSFSISTKGQKFNHHHYYCYNNVCMGNTGTVTDHQIFFAACGHFVLPKNRGVSHWSYSLIPVAWEYSTNTLFHTQLCRVCFKFHVGGNERSFYICCIYFGITMWNILKPHNFFLETLLHFTLYFLFKNIFLFCSVLDLDAEQAPLVDFK